MASFTASIPTFFNALTSTLPRKCLTSSLIWLTADSLSQHLIEKKPLSSHDFMRSLKHSIYSGVILAPSLAIWSNLTKEVVLRTNSRTVAARVALDQLVMAVVGLSMFGSYCTLTSGGGSKDIIERLDRVSTLLLSFLHLPISRPDFQWRPTPTHFDFQTWKTTLTTSWSIWIPAQFINYALVPPQQRILVMYVPASAQQVVHIPHFLQF